MASPLRNGKRAAVLEALRQGNTRRCACALAGISPDTFYRWLKEDRTLADEVVKAEGEAEQFFVGIIKKAAVDSWQAGAWWLERRLPKDYGRSDRLLVLQAMQRDVQGMTDEQLYAVAAGDRAGDTATTGADRVAEAGQAVYTPETST